MEGTKLIYPDYEGGSLYNLSHSIMISLGIQTRHPVIKDIPDDGKKMSIVLIDGFGYMAGIRAGILSQDDPYITSVFPSITTTALVTLMSGQTPGEHSILGGTTFVKRFGTIIDNFKYSPIYSKNKDSLRDMMPMKQVYQVENTIEKAEKLGKKCAIISPDFVKNSELTTVTNSTAGVHYHFHSIWDAMDLYDRALDGDFDFVYLYIPFADKLSHVYGPYSQPNLEALRDIVNAVKRVSSKYLNKFRVVITADHGHVEAGQAIQLGDNDQVTSTFSIPPFGSTRSIFLSGSSSLLEALNSQFPGLQIFDNSRQNLKKLLGSYEGHKTSSFDYIGIPVNCDSYFFPGSMDEGNTTYFKGRHGGLHPDEMMVPLIILE
ncbi:MAG: alkaline phosphatase family protein [Cuniculiplasma sp.]